MFVDRLTFIGREVVGRCEDERRKTFPQFHCSKYGIVIISQSTCDWSPQRN